MTVRNTESSLRWIVGILRKHGIPFQVTGGLAAKIYGSPRPLNDIDIDVPDDRLLDIVTDVKQYIVYGPSKFRDERWDLQLMTLNHEGQEIDISGASKIKICDARTGKWIACPTDFSRYEGKEIFGTKVPVIPREELVKYKNMLAGEHQKIDIDAVEKSIRP